MSQLPAYYGVEIDASQFMPAFSFLQDGQRVQANLWPLAPNNDVRHPFDERHKAAQDGLLVKQYDRLMQCIPLLKRNKYAEWDVTERAFGSRQNGMYIRFLSRVS